LYGELVRAHGTGRIPGGRLPRPRARAGRQGRRITREAGCPPQLGRLRARGRQRPEEAGEGRAPPSVPLLAPGQLGVHRQRQGDCGSVYLAEDVQLERRVDVFVLEERVFEHVVQPEEQEYGGDGLGEGQVVRTVSCFGLFL
jgi:hypothetical protein